ncbi:MAG: hypothetical protein L0206_05140, partial [Actinobacteria bacterium]|nr:hypothetical protein [Actinomycetota bacterium]
MKRAFLGFLVMVGCSFDVEKEGSNPGECSDGVDNDGNGAIDGTDGLCDGSGDSDSDTDTDVDTDADTDTGTACGEGLTECGGGCHDLQESNLHCGQCNN